MSLQILQAHTGKCFPTEPTALASLDALKTWLAQASSITPANQVLLTATGKQVKLQNLLVDVCLWFPWV